MRATLDFLTVEAGADRVDQIIALLPAAEREPIRSAAATDDVPLERLLSLWRAADVVIGTDDPEWLERSGAHAIGSLGTQRYGGILRKSSPLDFLTQRVSLFRLYYHPGNMEVVEQEDGRAVLRLVGFDARDPLFCRRQTGGLRATVALAGGRNPRATHVRCAEAGDAFCEWELRWENTTESVETEASAASPSRDARGG